METMTPPNSNPEASTQAAETYQRIAMLTSDVLFEQDRQVVNAEMDSPDIVQYDGLVQTKKALRQELREKSSQGADVLEIDQMSAELQRLEETDANYDESVRSRWSEAYGQLASLDTYKKRTAELNSMEGDLVRQLLLTAPRVQPTDPEAAPFKTYKQNTSEAWSHVTDQSVRDYLSERISLDTSPIEQQDNQSIVIKASGGEGIDVPLDVLVDLAGFDSWEGREGVASGKRISGQYQDSYDGQVASLDAIKHYAALPTEIPSVTAVHLFIQPNGLIFGNNGGGDSHRIAAAILRGETTIKADNVSIECIDRNILEPLDKPAEVENLERQVATAPEWEKVYEMFESFNLPQDAAERAKQLADMSVEDFIAMATLAHSVLAPEVSQTPMPETSTINSPDGEIKAKLLEPEDRYELFEHATDLIRKIGSDMQPGDEESFLKRVGNILALSTVIAHPFEDGNGRTARMLALLAREGFSRDNGEVMQDVHAAGVNRTFEGFRISSFIPKMHDMSPSEYLNKIAASEIALKDQQAYQESVGSLFTTPFADYLIRR